MTEQRIDSGTIFKSETTPEGFLRVWMTVSRTGKLRYFNKDGSDRIENVEAQELFHPDSLDTAWGKPITLNHPKEERVNADNASNLIRGMTQQTMLVNANFLTIVGVLSDREAIEAVKSGIEQVSAGYDTDLERRLDGFYQTKRRYNHFAIVPRGRAGDSVKIHQDCFRCDAVDESDRNVIFKQSQGNNMGDKQRRITLDNGISYEVDPDLAQEISALQSDRDAQKQRADAAEKQKDRFEGELSGLKEELESLKDSRQDADTVASEIQLRLDVWSEVLPSFSKDFQPDYRLNSVEIKRKYLEDVRGRTDLKDRSDEYIDGVYSHAKPNLDSDAKNKTQQHLDSLKNNESYDSQNNPLEAAREKARQDTETAYATN